MASFDDDLIKYYQNLLILQYKRLPKANEHLRALLSQVIIFDFLEEVTNAFDLETAVGDRLTRLGLFLGISREVRKVENERYFGLGSIYLEEHPVEADLSLVGFTSYYQDAAPGYPWTFSSLFQYIRNELQDNELRKFIQMRIAINKGNCSLAEVNDFFRTFFGGIVTVTEDLENSPMNLKYGVEQTSIEDFFLYMNEKKLFPRPAGVGIGPGFVSIQPEAFVYADSEVQDIEGVDNYGVPTKDIDIQENVLGYLDYDVEPIGAFVQYNSQERTDYEVITKEEL